VGPHQAENPRQTAWVFLILKEKHAGMIFLKGIKNKWFALVKRSFIPASRQAGLQPRDFSGPFR
jgi:hypothetical protein